MKVFQSFQKSLAMLGIRRNSNNLHAHPIDRNVLAVYIVIGLTVVSFGLFQYYGSHDFEESTKSIYFLTVFNAVIINFTFVVFRAKKVFEFIDVCEEIINESE